MQRALTEQEYAVAAAMIRYGSDKTTVAEDDRQRWLHYLSESRVSGQCGCGLCPSIYLDRDNTSNVESSRRKQVILSADTHRNNAIVLLFIDDDQPSYLEIAPMRNDPVILPTVEELVFREENAI